MAYLWQKVLGTSQSVPPSPTQSQDPDADFADFQSLSADPEPATLYASTATANPIQAASQPTGLPVAPRPYTKWYRVWERNELADFKQELFILPFVFGLLIFHFLGSSANKRKARKWITTIAPVLQTEFAQVGFKVPREELGDSELVKPEEALKSDALNEFSTFATGRQNVAFADLRLTLLKRYNPFLTLAEFGIGFFFESMPAPSEKTDITIFPFDGHEKELVSPSVGPQSSVNSSQYDGFVWAIVHKDKMKNLRDERYDLSLTSTKDHPKLSTFYTVMSESAEVTDAILTPELIAAIEKSGDELQSLIISDQPVEAPKKLDDLVSRKRMHITLSASTSPSIDLISSFIRLADHLPKAAHFRPEVQRRLKATRDNEITKIKKLDDDEKAEARKTSADKKKKEERDRLLKGMTADQQRKFLDREREKERRKGEKRRTMKG